MCAQKLTDASLIYRTEPKTKTRKMEKLKNKNGYAQKQHYIICEQFLGQIERS